MVIDFHTHIFPDKIAERTIQVLEGNILKVRKKPGHAVIGAKLDDLKASMKKNSIDVSVVLPIATSPRQTPSINRFAAEINGRGGIYSFGSLHPSQDDWETVLEGIKAAGLKGIKLHPEYQQFYIDSPESIRILKKCEELGLYTVLHAGHDIGIEPPVHCSPETLSHVLEYVRGDKIIAGHLGGWEDWDNVEKYLVGTPVMFDTAFTVFFIASEQLLRIIKNHGSDKILFATDSPWEDQGRSAEFVKALPLDKDDKDNILFKNAKKILNLS
jgi:predicted TIM-barrel fold metal-dependent hydrolase